MLLCLLPLTSTGAAARAVEAHALCLLCQSESQYNNLFRTGPVV